MDFELEMAFFVGGKTNALGQPIPMAEVCVCVHVCVCV